MRDAVEPHFKLVELTFLSVPWPRAIVASHARGSSAIPAAASRLIFEVLKVREAAQR